VISEKLLSILVCPACKSALESRETSLKCVQCKRVYPIEDGIPIMLVDRATVEA
jgi:uncharacterized protein YbaR (Trm112 family)